MQPRIYKVVTFFCGLGAYTLGTLRARSRSGSRFESIGAFDLDELACKDFELLTGAMAQVVDLGKIKPWQMAKRCEGVPDVVVMSPPCLPPEGLVHTRGGLRRIDSIAPEDLVLTHTGRYCRVDKVNRRRYVGKLHGIRLNGALEPQWYTDEHPIWARTYKHKKPMTRPEWRAAADVRPGDRVGFPVPREVQGTATHFVGQWGDPRIAERGGQPFVTNKIADLRGLATKPDLWLILGMYIGDGHRRPDRNEVTLSLGSTTGRKFRLACDALDRLGLSYRVNLEQGEGNARIRMEGRHLCWMCGEFGDGALNKRIPESLLGLELDLLSSLLLGLRLTDGTEREHGGWRLASISRQLLLDVQRALLRLGQFGCISQCAKAGTAVIEGRTVNTSDRFEIEVRVNTVRTTYKFEDGVVWLRVKSTEERDYDGEVWNLEVDEDDTYCSPLIATHNCKGFSGCLPESMSKQEKYEALNKLAYDAVRLAVKSWPGQLPKLILLENVPRMLNRGAKWLAKVTKLLRKHGYEINLEPHDCGEWGGLAQKRERLLLVARLKSACPSFLLRPPNLGLRPMSSVLWQLPPPVPGSTAGGPHHRLPKINRLNWLRLAGVREREDWRGIPARVHLVDVDPRMGGNTTNRQTGFYGVCSSDDPSHTIIAHARAGNASWASVTDPRLGDRASRQNGGFGVNDSALPSHAVLGEGTSRNTFSSVADGRVEPRFAGCINTGPLDLGDGSVDPRSACSRFEDAIGVSAAERPYKTPVIGHQRIENSPSSVCDPRISKRHADSLGVLDPSKPSKVVRGRSSIDVAPVSVADGRQLFQPTHELVAGQPLTCDREAWVNGEFWLVGPPVEIVEGARGTHMIIRAPDGTVHRPMTTAELMLLQNIPVWHRPGDPTELEIGDPSGQWVQLQGSDKLVREHVGNAVPVATAQAIGEVMLELLDHGASEVYQLSPAGVWVREHALAGVAA